jgi:hypothetical protein
MSSSNRYAGRGVSSGKEEVHQAIAAIDPLIEAVTVTGKNHPGEDRRPVMIHGRTLREDPVRRSRRRGSFPRLCDARR